MLHWLYVRTIWWWCECAWNPSPGSSWFTFMRCNTTRFQKQTVKLSKYRGPVWELHVVLRLVAVSHISASVPARCGWWHTHSLIAELVDMVDSRLRWSMRLKEGGKYVVNGPYCQLARILRIRGTGTFYIWAMGMTVMTRVQMIMTVGYEILRMRSWNAIGKTGPML
jgi:hypothetical protein